MNHYDQIVADFRAQEKWLFSLITDPEGKRYFEKKTHQAQQQELIDQLERTTSYLRFAGHPERQFKSVHVAGTSGKGSVTTMIAAILKECGKRTGHLTSPYLQLPTEKLMYNGQPIAPSEFAMLVRDFRAIYDRWLHEKAGQVNLRYGEAWVTLKYLWLAKREVEWGVVETGVGGRYDPTNALPAQLAVITNVDYDHTKTLGSELSAIAWHKAGIIKEGQMAITAASNPEVLEVIQAEAKDKGVTLYSIKSDPRFQMTIHDSHTISLKTPFSHYKQIHIKAKGAYQLENASLAMAAVDLLAQHYPIALTEEVMSRALATVTYPGRMEVVSTEPLVVLDAAHNPAKMAALVRSMRSSYPNKRVITVFGALAYKDVSKIIEILAPLTDHFVATEPHVFGKPATPAHILAESISRVSPTIPISFNEHVHAAIQEALAVADTNDVVLVTGSLYLAGEARAYWYPTEELMRKSEMEGSVL